MYFVRKLWKLKVDKSILSMFYQSTVESVLKFCITTWYGNINCNDRKKLNRIVRNAGKLGCTVNSVQDIYEAAAQKKCKCIMEDTSHPLHKCFTFLPSGVRLNSLCARTSRYKNSFVPSTIRLFNNSVL